MVAYKGYTVPRCEDASFIEHYFLTVSLPSCQNQDMDTSQPESESTSVCPKMEQSVLKTSEKRINGHSRSNRSWQRISSRRAVPLWFYLLTILFFICALLGLGLGLGIPLHNYTQNLNRDSAQLKNATSSHFNYSSFYGIPDHLPTVSSDKLFNDTELDMKTGFKVSNQSTTREYVLNITQALAAPDG